MARGQSRFALPLAALLLSVACTSNQQAPPPATQAPAEQAPDQAAPAAGTEATVTPQPQTGATDQAAASTIAPEGAAATPAEHASVRQTPPRPPRAPVAPAAPPAPASDDRDAGTAARDEAAARASEATARDSATAAARNVPAPPRMVSIPANTPLRLALQSSLGSDTSAVEDRVTARVTDDVVVDGETVIPEGSRVAGRVTYAQPSGRVKGRAGLTVRFHTLTIGAASYDIATEPVRREAQGTKSRDVRDIGIGAGAGAVIGGIIGGRKGAGIGAAVGGGAGAGKVLATKGEEVRLPAGTAITTRLADPLVVQLGRGGR